MAWEPVPIPGIRDVVLFDGDCVLCSDHARDIDRLDRARRFAFVTIQDGAGRWLAERLNVSAATPETNIVVVDGKAYFKSDAILALARTLPGRGWALVFRVIPRPLRDVCYDILARNRYRWFGRKEACALASPGLRGRVLTRPEQLGAIEAQ